MITSLDQLLFDRLIIQQILAGGNIRQELSTNSLTHILSHHSWDNLAIRLETGDRIPGPELLAVNGTRLRQSIIGDRGGGTVVKVDGNPPLLNRKDVQEIKTIREQKLSGRKGTGRAKQGDEIQLSEKVKLIMKLKDELSLQSDKETEKIERIKTLVKSGKYKVSSDLLAEKILEEEFGL